ncbi:MAG: acyl-ACP thioesterase domain-containing protein [Acidobacteriota bacterium]
MNKLNEKDLISTLKFKITSAETDMEARLRPGALVNLLIQSATHSADKLGFGYENLKKHNLFWVFSRLTVNIERPLKWNEVVEVETWPKDIDGLLYTRDFILRDERGKIVVKAASAWLPIDLETKRPKRKESFESDFFTYLKDKHALKDPPEKLPGVTEGDVFEVRSTYFDIDLNKHVTSTRYIDWMMNTFSINFLQNNYPKVLSINYVKEAMPEAKLNIIRTSNNDKEEFLLEGVNSETEKTSFRGKVIF